MFDLLYASVMSYALLKVASCLTWLCSYLPAVRDLRDPFQPVVHFVALCPSACVATKMIASTDERPSLVSIFHTKA